MKPSDLGNPIGLLLALGAGAVAGFAAGFMAGRDPEFAQRVSRTVGGGLMRAQVAAAEAREQLADLLAEAREGARHAVESGYFAEAATTGASAAAAAAATPPAEADAGAPREDEVSADGEAPLGDAIDGEAAKPTRRRPRRPAGAAAAASTRRRRATP